MYHLPSSDSVSQMWTLSQFYSVTGSPSLWFFFISAQLVLWYTQAVLSLLCIISHGTQQSIWCLNIQFRSAGGLGTKSDCWDPVGYSPPGSSVPGIPQARKLEWVDISFSQGSSRPRVRTWISCLAVGFFTAEGILSSSGFSILKCHPRSFT